MALPFSQSMRSLQADRGISTIVWFVIALTIFLIWIAWFLWAPITRYETGTLIGMTRDGRVVAEFPSQAWEELWQGQAAYILLHPQPSNGDGNRANDSPIPALVANILGRAPDDKFQVSFTILEYTPALEGTISGEVVVEVEQLSPAILVGRASSQFIDTPSLSFSPQHSP